MDSKYTVQVSDAWADLPDNNGLNSIQRINALKKINPKLQTLFSIGGATANSKTFSNMVATAATRKVFIKSAVDFVQKYMYNGMDIDWEFPTVNGGVAADKVIQL